MGGIQGQEGGANTVLVLKSVNSLTWGQLLIVPIQQVERAWTTAAGLNMWLRPFGGSHIRYPVHQILTLQSTTVTRLQLRSSNEYSFVLGGYHSLSIEGSQQ